MSCHHGQFLMVSTSYRRDRAYIICNIMPYLFATSIRQILPGVWRSYRALRRWSDSPGDLVNSPHLELQPLEPLLDQLRGHSLDSQQIRVALRWAAWTWQITIAWGPCAMQQGAWWILRSAVWLLDSPTKLNSSMLGAWRALALGESWAMATPGEAVASWAFSRGMRSFCNSWMYDMHRLWEFAEWTFCAEVIWGSFFNTDVYRCSMRFHHIPPPTFTYIYLYLLDVTSVNILPRIDALESKILRLAIPCMQHLTEIVLPTEGWSSHADRQRLLSAIPRRVIVKWSKTKRSPNKETSNESQPSKLHADQVAPWDEQRTQLRPAAAQLHSWAQLPSQVWSRQVVAVDAGEDQIHREAAGTAPEATMGPGPRWTSVISASAKQGDASPGRMSFPPWARNLKGYYMILLKYVQKTELNELTTGDLEPFVKHIQKPW